MTKHTAQHLQMPNAKAPWLLSILLIISIALVYVWAFRPVSLKPNQYEHVLRQAPTRPSTSAASGTAPSSAQSGNTPLNAASGGIRIAPRESTSSSAGSGVRR